MEREEVGAMATQLESSVRLERSHLESDDFLDVKINGGMVAIDSSDRWKGTGGGGIIELPKTKGGSKEEGSSTTAKPAGGRKRTKMVKHRIDKSLEPFFQKENKEPIHFDLSRRSEAFAAARRNYLETVKSIVKQFGTKGYAEYEREEEVTDDEEDPNSV